MSGLIACFPGPGDSGKLLQQQQQQQAALTEVAQQAQQQLQTSASFGFLGQWEPGAAQHGIG